MIFSLFISIPFSFRHKVTEVKSAISRPISSNGAPPTVFSRIEPSTRSNDDVKITQLVKPNPQSNVCPLLLVILFLFVPF